MDKLLHLLPGLEGKEVRVCERMGGPARRGTVMSIPAVAEDVHVKVLLEDGAIRRLRVREIFQAYFSSLMDGAQGNDIPKEIKLIMVDLVQRVRAGKETTKDDCFKSVKELIETFREHLGVRVSKSALMRWARGESLCHPGRRPALVEEAEKLLVQEILRADEFLSPMCEKDILRLASKFTTDKFRFGRCKTPGHHWYMNFKQRASIHFPHAVQALSRTMDSRTTQWFNSENLHWWFKKFNEKIVDLGFARPPGPGESGESKWLKDMMGRVLLSDETCVSGGGKRKAKNAARKVWCDRNRVEHESSGKRPRRRVPNYARDVLDEHITALCSVTLNCQVAPIVFILSAQKDISAASRAELEEAVGKCGGLRPGVDLPDFNGRGIDEAFISTSEKGGMTSSNITGIMCKMFKTLYPDVEDVPGKRVLWLTDWHGSRLHLPLIDSLKDMGVRMLGWLPNTMSKTQLADVCLFGHMKAKLEALERDAAPSSRRAILTNVCKAVVATFTRDRILEGARLTGILPVDSTQLLNHPAAMDGDVLRERFDERAALKLLKIAQRTSPPTSPQDADESSTPQARTELFSRSPLFKTPEREGQADAVYSTVSQSKTRLGKRRSMQDAAKTPIAIEDYRSRVKGEIDERITQRQQEMEISLNVLQRDAARAVDHIINGVHHAKAVHLQEITFLKRLSRELSTEVVSSEKVSRIDEMLDDLRRAPRDQYGLAQEEPDTHQLPSPTLPGVDVNILQEFRQGLSVPHQDGMRGRRLVNKDGTVPFRIGSIIHATGEIEGTSSPVRSIVSAYEQRKEDVQRAREAKVAKRSATIEALPALLESIRPQAQKNTVADCRAYARALREEALARNDRARADEISKIMKSNGIELKQMVTTMAHPRSSAEPME